MGGSSYMELLFLLLLLGAFETTFGNRERTSGRGFNGGARPQKDRHDALKLARCDVKCWDLQKPGKNECVKRCQQHEKKPGDCQAAEELNVWDAACVQACRTDANCPGLLKCCQHNCGATCQHPRGLHKISALPTIPQNVVVVERPRGRTVRVRWTPSTNSNNSPILYVIEERQYIGKHFAESKFEEWMARKRSKRNSITLKHVKPGRWYQFRVAAVNENGTRGFSSPSQAFTTSHGPRIPGLPQNLTVDTIQYYNKTFNGILRWKPPLQSDLPIQKYKVYWSRRLKEVDQEQNSVLVNSQTVNKDQTYCELNGLQPKSLYFLQVQALSQFGTTRLKSDKAAIFLDTKKFSNDTIPHSDGNSSKRSADHKIESLSLRKIYWNKELFARISWKPVISRTSNNIRYSVQWWTGPCDGEDKGFKLGKQMAVTTEITRLDLYDLNFGCKYTVYVNKIPDEDKSSHKAVMTFTTMSCEELKMKTRNDKIKCN